MSGHQTAPAGALHFTTATVQACTCNFTWGYDAQTGRVTEVRRPMLSGCAAHPVQHCPGCQCESAPAQPEPEEHPCPK